jgi:hypothetical protein
MAAGHEAAENARTAHAAAIAGGWTAKDLKNAGLVAPAPPARAGHHPQPPPPTPPRRRTPATKPRTRRMPDTTVPPENGASATLARPPAHRAGGHRRQRGRCSWTPAAESPSRQHHRGERRCSAGTITVGSGACPRGHWRARGADPSPSPQQQHGLRYALLWARMKSNTSTMMRSRSTSKVTSCEESGSASSRLSVDPMFSRTNGPFALSTTWSASP